jgi:hypothetical protein
LHRAIFLLVAITNFKNRSNLEVTVKHSCYKGNTFLVKGIYDKKVLFFENRVQLDEGQNVFLKLEEELVEFRR